jgi:hypothetical protein
LSHEVFVGVAENVVAPRAAFRKIEGRVLKDDELTVDRHPGNLLELLQVGNDGAEGMAVIGVFAQRA